MSATAHKAHCEALAAEFAATPYAAGFDAMARQWARLEALEARIAAREAREAARLAIVRHMVKHRTQAGLRAKAARAREDRRA